MIDQIDQKLMTWMKDVMGEIAISLEPPGRNRNGRGISVYLFELAKKPPLRGAERPPLQVALHYLVTTWADTPEAAHQILGELTFAAMAADKMAMEVDLEPLPSAFWATFNLPPQPAFILCVPLRKERSQPSTQRVRLPLDVHATPITSLHGVVVGPEDTPLANALVELPSLQQSVYTDGNGRFRFPTVPASPPVTRLRIRAKGLTQEMDVAQLSTDEGALVIHFNFDL